MSTPILATKLYIPSPRPKMVVRSRLLEQLNAGLYRKLTLIAAPAGFGKTTLTSEWVANCQQPVAWLSLDEGDNDLNHFLVYFVTALQTIQPNMGKAILEILQGPPPVPTESVLAPLLNEIANIPENFTLVLDDYHLINEASIDEVLTFLLDHLPPQMHLVIVTREEPDLPLARLRVRDQLTEFRVADLRFTATETADFLNHSMGFSLSPADIEALEKRTEGWIAGLQLAALALRGSLQQQKDAHLFIQSFTGSHRFVFDYLVEEILQQQPEAVQTFLLNTSILERMCAPLCKAILGELQENGQTTLEYLERANLLIVPLDDARQWYRYHPLFAEVLQTRLHKEQPNKVADLHRQAYQWYEQNHLRAEAIRHALAAQDFEQAANLIELEWSVIRRSCFRSPMWLSWVSDLPSELVQVRPVLCVGYAWELLNFGEVAAAEEQMQFAERWLESEHTINEQADKADQQMVVVNKAEFPSLRGVLANARAYHAQAVGDVTRTVKYAQQVLSLVAEDDHYTRGIANSFLGLAAWTEGDLEAACAFISQCIASLKLAGNMLFAIHGSLFVADIQAAQGRLRKAIAICDESLQLATQFEPPLQGTANVYLGLSEFFYEQGNLEAARDYLSKGKAVSESAALPDWQYRFFLYQARMRQAQGNLDAALACLADAERLHYVVPVPDVHPIAAMKARVWLAQGKLDDVRAWVAERPLSLDDDLHYLREFEHFVLARLLVANGRSSLNPHPLLNRLLKAAEAGKRTRSIIEILLLQTLAHHTQNNTSAALIALQQALTLAEPEGYVQLFVDEGQPIHQLLRQLQLKCEPMKAYVQKLLTAFTGSEPTPVLNSSPMAQPLLEPLSQRELEILQLVADGLSNRQISERLFLALSTVKGHNRRIFDKLQVKRRTEAVARARELGVL